MGWGDCGEDSNGRPIGYSFGATCDHPGCTEEIDRGLSYVCGNMHGDDEYSCEKYFCDRHKLNYIMEDDGTLIRVCNKCYADLQRFGEWVYNEDEGVLMRSKL